MVCNFVILDVLRIVSDDLFFGFIFLYVEGIFCVIVVEVFVIILFFLLLVVFGLEGYFFLRLVFKLDVLRFLDNFFNNLFFVLLFFIDVLFIFFVVLLVEVVVIDVFLIVLVVIDGDGC